MRDAECMMVDAFLSIQHYASSFYHPASRIYHPASLNRLLMSPRGESVQMATALREDAAFVSSDESKN